MRTKYYCSLGLPTMHWIPLVATLASGCKPKHSLELVLAVTRGLLPARADESDAG